MRNLWREAGVAALLCGTLAACASPQYAIDDRAQSGHEPAMARPQYPITEDAAAAPRAAPRAATPVDATPNDSVPSDAALAAPVAPVESQSLPSLPPPGPSAASSRSDGATFQLAMLEGAGAMPAPAPTSAAPVTTAPGASPPPAPATADTAAAPAPAPAAAAEPALTPQMVIHDQTSPPPTAAARPAITLATPSGGSRLAQAGQVVDSSGEIFENYLVQRGDHIDALARQFATSRDVLAEANRLRQPYTIHPGQIMKVPVTKAYIAKAGDTLTGVARRFSVGAPELAQLNHVGERAPLRPGQEIGLPSSMRDLGASGGQYAEGPLETRLPRTTSTYTQAPRSYAQIPPSQPGQTGGYQGGGYQAGPAQSSVVQVAPTMSDAEISTAARGRFVWPVRGDIAARFGPAGVGRRNDGVDIRAAQGTPVKAAAPGEVVYAGNQVPGFGNLVLVKHADGWVTAYAYLDEIDVQMRQQVTQGQSVGTVGASGGVATQPELHFEVRYAPTPADKARPVDPVLVLPTG